MAKNTKTLRQFAKSFQPWLPAMITALLLAAASAVCGLFGPKLLGDITTIAVSSLQTAGAVDWNAIGQIVFILIVLYIVSAILSYLEGLVLTFAVANYTKKLRTEQLLKISRLPISYFDKHQFGDTLSRMSNDVNIIANTLGDVLTQLVTTVVTIVGILIMMITISPVLALVALVSVPISIFLSSKLAKIAQKYFRTQQDTLGNLSNIIEEDYAGQSIIKANSHGQKSLDAFERTNQKLYQNAWKAQFFSALAHPIVLICTNLSYVVICVLGGNLALSGAITIGGIQAFIQYVNQFNRPITSISQILSNIQQAIAGASRIFDFLSEPEEIPDPEPAEKITNFRGAVEFKNVNFSYTPERPIIKDFSVKIKPGMHVAIVGPTGAGKTTIINLLMRFYDPNSGEILIDGVPTAKMKRSDVRQMFGMVLQDTWLFSGTIEDNLKYSNHKADHSDVVVAAKASNTHHFIQSLDHGYKTQIAEDSDNISMGEKQLFTIARAMVANPPMMILDEATSNVDTRTEQLIQDAFDKLTKGRTSFVIAHRLSTIRNSDLILVMKDGNIIEQGNHTELLEQNGFYAELYNSQFAED